MPPAPIAMHAMSKARGVAGDCRRFFFILRRAMISALYFPFAGAVARHIDADARLSLPAAA